jgi:putative DNA primase/helicase
MRWQSRSATSPHAFAGRYQSTPTFLLGWTVLAPVCGALDWRPHAWITGGAGTGKTTILKHFLRPLLGGIYQAATGGTTEAGLRGTLRSDAIPVVFDEFEQNEQRDKQIVQNVLALARIASSEGGKIYKGTTSGGANAFEIRSMFCVSSINVALIQKADIDRFCVLGLRKDPLDKDEWTAFEQDILATITPDCGRQLIARTVQNIPTIRKNAHTLAKALAIQFGQRYGDQYGTLLAGAWSLSPGGGEPLTVEQAHAWIKTMNWESQQTDPSDADEVKCLNHILNTMVLADNHRITIRELFCPCTHQPSTWQRITSRHPGPLRHQIPRRWYCHRQHPIQPPKPPPRHPMERWRSPPSVTPNRWGRDN